VIYSPGKRMLFRARQIRYWRSVPTKKWGTGVIEVIK
jgi:hypothetical protein